jgi:hypothetical protein
MESAHWKHGWRLWSPRSYAEALDTRTGDRLAMRLSHLGRGISYDRFGPNVGQPNPKPPIHPLHRDLRELTSGLKLGCWTQDGCYELELDRPDVRLKMILADSRSLACGPSDDPLMRQGILLGQVECTHLGENIELCFEAIAAGSTPIGFAVLDGPARVHGYQLRIGEGVNRFAAGRLPEQFNRAKALKRMRQMTSFVLHYGPAQLNGPQRMGHAVRWNLCYDMAGKDIFLAVSRSWVQMMAQMASLPDYRRGPLIFGWDSALSALLVSRTEATLGRAIVRSVLSRQQPDGRLPFVSLGPHDGDRCAPPLLSLAAWYLSYDGSTEFTAEVFPKLAQAHRYLMDHREPRKDGLLCWGNDKKKSSPLRIEGWVGAAYESGMDNSPMWEELGFDEEHQTLGLACLDLCSMAALSARILAALAERVGDDPAPFVEDYRRVYHAVNSRLWGGDELYHNLRLDGSLGASLTPTSFYPLIAGLVPKDRATTLIQRHLRSRETFWSHPMLPSLARSSPFYEGDGDYWRGRIWPPMNYLVWAGLRQYNPAEAAHLAEHCRDLFEEEWEKEGHVHENYSAVTGRGEPAAEIYARSCPMYCWGGLLLLPDQEGKIGGAMARLPQIKVD